MVVMIEEIIDPMIKEFHPCIYQFIRSLIDSFQDNGSSAWQIQEHAMISIIMIDRISIINLIHHDTIMTSKLKTVTIQNAFIGTSLIDSYTIACKRMTGVKIKYPKQFCSFKCDNLVGFMF